MAATSMTMAVGSTRFAVVSTRAESSLSRNASALSMAAPLAGPSAMSCSFLELSLSKKSAVNSSIVARAAEVSEYTFGEVETNKDDLPDVDLPDVRLPPVQLGAKLYVGNLPWTCDSAQLAEICLNHGTVEEVEVIYDQESGRSRGFAFVTMASNEDAQAVINSLDGTDMGGRTLRVNYPQSNKDKPRFERGERPQGGSRRPSDDPNKLFVGNLTWGCDEGALYQLFSDFGKVVDAKVVYDRDSAIENLDGADFEGRQLRVNLAGEKPPPRF